MITNLEEIAVGDVVFLADRTFTGERREIRAKIIDIRYILGKQTFVVETENGTRKVVGESQISQVEG